MGVIETLEQIDIQLFLFLNGIHSGFWDEVMAIITLKYTWVPLYLLLLVYLIKKHKVKSIVYICAFILVISLADQLSSGLFKPLTERLRPCYNPDIAHLVHTVNNHCGGRYGFFSGHAANTFAGATLFWLLFRKNNRYTSLAFFWALIVAYSRIYVGVHFPGDVLAGIISGILLGWVVYLLLQLTLRKIKSYKTSSTT